MALNDSVAFQKKKSDLPPKIKILTFNAKISMEKTCIGTAAIGNTGRVVMALVINTCSF